MTQQQSQGDRGESSTAVTSVQWAEALALDDAGVTLIVASLPLAPAQPSCWEQGLGIKDIFSALGRTCESQGRAGSQRKWSTRL